MHLTVDGRRRRLGVPWTEGLVEEWCDRAVLHAGMIVVSGPKTKQFEGHVYGMVILAESHAAAHLDVVRGAAFLEMFSCKAFDEEGFASLCVETFSLVGVQINRLDRKLPP